MSSLLKNIRKRFGFTLTEMLVVVMVVSVLAAIAYPLYTKTATKSRAIEAINLLEMVRNKQLQKFAKDKSYYSSFANMGQLTTNKNKEVIEGQVLKVKDYTLSLNNVHSCMKARYNKGSTDFTFSSSYEFTGLGCTGDICTSFGDIIGTAQDVCNCGSKACNGGYTLNQDTCQCQCLLGCDISGSCFAPYGGGSTRTCASGCGTETSSSTCNGPSWTGTCWSPTQTQTTSQTCASGCGTQTRTCTANCTGGSCGAWNTSSCYSPTQTQPTTQSCGNSGTQTRTCTASCGGGSCTSWSSCTGQTCPSSTKPAESQACGNCGTQTRTVSCNTNTGAWTTGSWGTCTGTGVCTVGATQTCNTTGTQTCSSSCTWGTCSVQTCPEATKPAASEPCGNCGTQSYIVTCNTSTGQWQRTAQSTCTGQGVCAVGATQTCNGTGTQTCSSSCAWGSCSVQACSEAAKPAATQSCGNCNKGTQSRTVTCTNGSWVTGSWGTCSGGGVCVPGTEKAITCPDGPDGAERCDDQCNWYTRRPCEDSIECVGSDTQSCGNCNLGTQTRTCDTAVGSWRAWGTCTGGGTCSPGQTQSCGNGGTQTCTSSCTWGTTCAGQTCPAATKPAEDEDCGPCGLGYRLRTVTCDTNTGNWTTGEWGQCGAQGCTPGTTAVCGGGNGKQTCDSSCFWSGCVCNSGYTWSGGTCALPTITPSIKSTSVVTSCNAVSGGSCLSYTYTLCQPGTGGWAWPSGYNPDDCRSRTSQPVCYNDYIQGGTASQFSCSSWSLPSCSGSNYQSICNANGKGYKCKISASGGTGNAATACMCDWYAYNSYSGYCDAASGLSCVTIYFDGEGTGTYLSCE